MELNISEFDDSQINYEQIPENIIPKIKVVKKETKVRFEEQPFQNQNIKPMNSGVKARMVRPYQPEPKPKISYDDILNKMGMFVAEGKLHLLEDKTPTQQANFVQKTPIQQTNVVQNPVQNSYIYNKYFQNNEYGGQEQPQRPLTPLEYRDMLIKNII